jgi:hypothetical protein
MRELPSGTRSTTKQTNRGHPALDILERDASTEDAMAIPQQEPHNAKTMMVFMTVVLADDGLPATRQGGFQGCPTAETNT